MPATVRRPASPLHNALDLVGGDRGAVVPAAPLAEGLERVSDELARRDIPREFAPLTLAASIAALTFRVRRATGRPGGNEAGSIRVMAAAEELLIAEPTL